MAVEVNIAVGKGTYQISCDEGEENLIQELGKRLNKRVNELALSLGRVDDKLLLLMAGLTMESEIEDLKNAVKSGGTNSNNQEQQPGLSQADVYNKTSENLESVIKYIEELANKIENDYN